MIHAKATSCFKGFSYGQPAFLPKEFLEKYQVGADRHAAKENPTGMADIAYDCLLEHRKKQVDVKVQLLQQVATSGSQQTMKLVQSTISMSMPDVEPEMAMGMIMPHCSPGFFPG